MYKNIVSHIDRYSHEIMDHKLQKYNFRIQVLTYAQIEEMLAQVEAIVAMHITLAASSDNQPHKGKRAYHDSMLDGIKAISLRHFAGIM